MAAETVRNSSLLIENSQFALCQPALHKGSNPMTF